MFVSFCFPRVCQKLSFLFDAGCSCLPPEVRFLDYRVTIHCSPPEEGHTSLESSQMTRSNASSKPGLAGLLRYAIIACYWGQPQSLYIYPLHFFADRHSEGLYKLYVVLLWFKILLQCCFKMGYFQQFFSWLEYTLTWNILFNWQLQSWT